jgi:uncharacterized protein (TIGR00661 family)
MAGDLISFGKFKLPIEVNHVGSLSRFANTDLSPEHTHDFTYKVLAICSGPEPQRSLLDEIVSTQLKNSGLRYFIVRGVISSDVNRTETSADFLTTNDLKNKILQSEFIIARSGFSTLMDLSALRKKAIFIPTPGQTEQEYLAKKLKQSGIADYQDQNDFSLEKALRDAGAFTGFVNPIADNTLLNKALDQILH